MSQPTPSRAPCRPLPPPSPAAVATAPPSGPAAVPAASTATPSNAGAAPRSACGCSAAASYWPSLIFGVVGALIFGYFAFSLPTEASARQLIRVQKIQTDLLTADATATNAFLIGGLERPAQRATYDQAITEASALIAEAARQPADGAALAALNDEIVHAGTVEQARANNRQGLPVGAQYMRIASTELRTVALPIATNRSRRTPPGQQSQWRSGASQSPSRSSDLQQPGGQSWLWCGLPRPSSGGSTWGWWPRRRGARGVNRRDNRAGDLAGVCRVRSGPSLA